LPSASTRLTLCQQYSFNAGLYTLSSPPQTTRARILEATLALIARAPGPIAMGAIAKEAGLSRQALYLTFADKADLFVALLRYVDGKRGLVQELAAIRDAPTAREALAMILDLQARLNPGYKPIVDAFEVLRRQDPAAESAWRDRQDHRLEGSRAVIARLAAEGRLRPGLDPALAADLLWTLTSVAVWDDLVTQRGWSAEAYRDHLHAQLVAWLVG
jgi:AcrR family transcriptional regulator